MLPAEPSAARGKWRDAVSMGRMLLYDGDLCIPVLQDGLLWGDSEWLCRLPSL